MKKLMVVAAVAMAAFCTNAAAWTWKVSGTAYEAGSSSKTISSGTAYLFDAGVTTQTALLQAFFDDGTDISTLAVAGAPSISITSAGKGSGESTEFTYSDSSAKNFYSAVLFGGDILIVDSKSVTGTDTGSAVIQTSSFTAPSKNAAITWVKDGSYSAAGWYTAAPEPTSGLLLLLGMAGLALRRRRA